MEAMALYVKIVVWRIKILHYLVEVDYGVH